MIASFESDLQWSLSVANTSTAVRLLQQVYPARSWVLCCNTTDRAGCDLLGLRADRQPIRVDLKVRRGVPADPNDPDVIFDVEYRTESGLKLPGPLLRPVPLAVDFQLHLWPEAQVGAIVDARRAQFWLRQNWEALKKYQATSGRESGAQWSTTFVAPSAQLLCAFMGDAVRVLTAHNDDLTLP